ncbi:MAG: hypothetical protein PHG66_05285 [Candidatus Colwellbacteria bacterium]|nr:hypothetical protein [Candidatus Colwellbacteria bacterium]
MSLLIKGGDIVDGSGNTPKKGDVLLIGDRIAAIGSLASYKADKVIQASGYTVTPGFIDIASGADRRLSLFSDHGQEESLSQGITTIIGGCDGVSLAPIIYGSLESFSPWAKKEGVNIDWRTTDELFNTLSNSRFGVNFASFAGYKTIKASVAGRKRGLSKTESSIMANLVSQAIEDGMIGVSFPTDEVTDDGMSNDEERSFISAISTSKGTVSIRLPIGNKKPSEDVIKALRFAKAGIQTLLNGFSRTAVSEKEMKASLSAIEDIRTSAFIAMSICPLGVEEVLLKDILPKPIWTDDTGELISAIMKKRGETAISKVWPIEKLRRLWIADSPKASFLAGKNLSDFADNRGLSPAACFSELIKISGGDIVFYLEITREDVFEKAVINPRVAIESGAYGGMSAKSDIHTKMMGGFPSYFEIADRRGLNIEHAIMKTTSLAASICGLKKRGTIETGSYGDVMIMKDRKAEHVIVGGMIAMEDGRITGERGGKVLRRNA